MADGPPPNLPPGFDAYGGYVNRSGIGITYPQVVAIAKLRGAIAFSITTDGSAAQCADVERGAMSSWRGYSYGYCSVANVNRNIELYGRPKKLWTSHYNSSFGAHICSPACWPGLVTTADGTQWTDHSGAYDESLLAADFFDLAPLPPPSTDKETTMQTTELSNGRLVTPAVGAGDSAGHLFLVLTNLDGTAPVVLDVTAEAFAAGSRNPDGTPYTFVP